MWNVFQLKYDEFQQIVDSRLNIVGFAVKDFCQRREILAREKVIGIVSENNTADGIEDDVNEKRMS